jgi:hypothetical protein
MFIIGYRTCYCRGSCWTLNVLKIKICKVYGILEDGCFCIFKRKDGSAAQSSVADCGLSLLVNKKFGQIPENIKSRTG